MKAVTSASDPSELAIAFKSSDGAYALSWRYRENSLGWGASMPKEGIAIMKDKSRQLPNPEMLTPPDINGALQDVITNFWNKNQSVDGAQKAFASALKS